MRLRYLFISVLLVISLLILSGCAVDTSDELPDSFKIKIYLDNSNSKSEHPEFFESVLEFQNNNIISGVVDYGILSSSGCGDINGEGEIGPLPSICNRTSCIFDINTLSWNSENNEQCGVPPGSLSWIPVSKQGIQEAIDSGDIHAKSECPYGPSVSICYELI